jgi:hypothetical protein
MGLGASRGTQVVAQGHGRLIPLSWRVQQGHGSVMARGCDKSQEKMLCQQYFGRILLARAMPTCPLASRPHIIALDGRGMDEVG